MDNRYLTMKSAAVYIGQTTRWMRRHCWRLIREGVTAYRVPKDAPKGRLMFSKDSLDQYLKNCCIKPNERHTPLCDSCGKQVNPTEKDVSEVYIFGMEPRNHQDKRWVCKVCSAREKERLEDLWRCVLEER